MGMVWVIFIVYQIYIKGVSDISATRRLSTPHSPPSSKVCCSSIRDDNAATVSLKTAHLDMDLLLKPAGPPPPGVHSNFVNPESLQNPAIAVNVIFLSLATTAVVMRLYAKGVVTRAVGWDDCMCRRPFILENVLTRLDVCILALVNTFLNIPFDNLGSS